MLVFVSANAWGVTSVLPVQAEPPKLNQTQKLVPVFHILDPKCETPSLGTIGLGARGSGSGDCSHSAKVHGQMIVFVRPWTNLPKYPWLVSRLYFFTISKLLTNLVDLAKQDLCIIGRAVGSGFDQSTPTLSQELAVMTSSRDYVFGLIVTSSSRR